MLWELREPREAVCQKVSDLGKRHHVVAITPSASLIEADEDVCKADVFFRLYLAAKIISILEKVARNLSTVAASVDRRVQCALPSHVSCVPKESDLPELVLRLPLFRGMVLSYVSARLRLDTRRLAF